MITRLSRLFRREHRPVEPAPLPQDIPLPVPQANPPGRFWAIGVLVLSALVSMSMNTWHAWTATSLPKPLAVLYGVAPVALAAMQSHAVALRALRKEKVGPFRRALTFALVLGGLGLSFLGIYDMLRHAVPDPIPAVPVHEPAVFFSIVIDLMALAALHELLRESPSFVSAVRATETVAAVAVEAVPGTIGQSPTVDTETVTETRTTSSTKVENDPVPQLGNDGVPDPLADVPPHVNGYDPTTDSDRETVVTEPMFSDQVQPDQPVAAVDPLGPMALREFLADVAMGTPPPVRTIKERMGVGTDRARRLQSYLGGLVEVSR
ncbi:hypothetical protein ACFYUV_03880 [Nonomuraea sp. NPDC003560]|uniref:hypothetical protein n=1 Tax=Nonomuraea sp. NPDC003560 TaxID=3364341 RepID=UPI0036BB6009